MEFFIVFVASAFFLLLIGVAMAFGKSPGYRPDRQYVLKLMKGVEDRSTSQQAWDMLIGYPISHDPELEAIRQQLVDINEGSPDRPAAKQGINGYIYDRENRQRLQEVIVQLEKLIAEAPIVREF